MYLDVILHTKTFVSTKVIPMIHYFLQTILLFRRLVVLLCWREYVSEGVDALTSSRGGSSLLFHLRLFSWQRIILAVLKNA